MLVLRTMDHQDWTPTTLINTRAIQAKAAAVAAAGPKFSATAIQHGKIAASDGPVHVKKLTADAVKLIQDFRRANSLTQKQLDQRLSLRAGTICDLESRRAGPSTHDLRILGSLLKTGLTLE